METQTVSRMQSLVVLYDMHTTFFKKALEGIREEDTHQRLNTKANHIAWLAGTLLEQRYAIARDSGIQMYQSSYELFKDNKGIQEGVTYPSLAQYKADWDTISPITREVLVNVSDDQLDGQIDMGGMKMSLYEMASFGIYREANCIGQLALWRRLLCYEPMKYD